MTRVYALIGAAFVIAVGGYFALGPSEPGTTAISPLVSAANAQDASAEVDTSSVVEMTLGAEDAPITMIEYASFTCPHCAAFSQGPYKEIKKNYIDTGKVKLIYRDVYFDRFGLWASMVARCGGPEKFFGIADLIYKDQAEWSRAGEPAAIVDALKKIGRLAGIDGDALEACLQDETQAKTLVAWYQKNAEADGINATPSFIINGQKVSNQSYEDFAKFLDGELAK